MVNQPKLSVPDRLIRRLADITIYEAKQILEALTFEYMLSEIVAIDWNAHTVRRTTTPAAEYHVVWNCYAFAQDVRVDFIGGPPGKAIWVSGTFLLYVCDRILYHAAVFKPQSVMHVLKPYGFIMKTESKYYGKRCADGSIVGV
jgi:hypothetical protein